MAIERKSGILLHISSLPNNEGIGTLGKEARIFIDFLSMAGQRQWQILPLGHTGYGDSPYQSFSTFAGNPLLISLSEMVSSGWLVEQQISACHNLSKNKVDYGAVIVEKFKILWEAWQGFNEVASREDKIAFSGFCSQNTEWLDDYALFMELKNVHQGEPWYSWENKYRIYNKESFTEFISIHQVRILFWKFLQFVFSNQWRSLKLYANDHNIEIVGDLPLYIAHDSADAWANSAVFQFDDNKNPTHVAGVPPDYFSETGQLWGNPLYDWNYLRQTGFKWWLDRVGKCLEWYDMLRIDHFRGFAAYWSVPFTETTAINGQWVNAPGKELFDAIKQRFGSTPIIAEDLGVITPDVEELRDSLGFPGMKILQFAFQPAKDNEYLPHNYVNPNCVCYSGTHDNDTVLGWFDSLDPDTRESVKHYIPGGGESFAWKVMRLAWRSTAAYAIAPMQDLLELGSEARMNVPGKPDGNWQWRFRNGDLTKELALQLKSMSRLYDRC
ncbi:MAG: 4-alpha-glucanotransferase [Bacteroidales bacterium]|jgi:4-alpha-glucanotransferase|nr:4-alpha-glucanotransferase [Bacteroidales bacterium]